MKHLIIALSTKGYGETILGIRVARELHARGERCHFLIHESAVSLLTDTPFQHTKFSDHAMGLLKMTLLVLMNKARPDAIILSDYFTADLAFSRAGIDPSTLKKFGVPLAAIDTWDMARSGTAIDVFGVERRRFADWSDLLDVRMIPVPIANPQYRQASYYDCLPEPVEIARKVRRHIRRDLGVGDDERAVLFCTAGWQHAIFNNDHANRLARLFPELIAAYLTELGPKVHLFHVGPSPYSTALGERYHWLPPLLPERFDLVLASADLLLAANASSTTISKALVSGIPSVVLVNSATVGSVEEFMQGAHSQPLTQVAGWVRSVAPLFPFSMWPIGYHEFLEPLLRGNDYCEAVPMLEALDQPRVLDELGALLFDSGRRGQQIERQAQYVAAVHRLPTAGSLVPSFADRSAR